MKLKFFILLGALICVSVATAVPINFLLYKNEANIQNIAVPQTSTKSHIITKVSYPEIKNTEFIASLIVGNEINHEKLSIYFDLLNIPSDAVFELDFVKIEDDGMLNLILSISPWIDETNTLVTTVPLKSDLTIQLLPPNYVPPQSNYNWLWILIGVVGAIILIFVIALSIQRAKDLKQFPYKLDLG